MKPRLAVFFSHPTQHHSVMFNALLNSERMDVDVFYFDPGSFGGMEDADFKVKVAWDVDVLAGGRIAILANLLRGKSVNALRQFNPGVVSALLRKRYDAVYVAGYVSISNWLVLLTATLLRCKVLYQSDANVIELREKSHSWWHRLLYRTYLAGVDGFLVIGDNNRAAYRRMGAGHKHMAWCPYPFDAARFVAETGKPGVRREVADVRQRHGIPEDAIVVISAGKLIPRKRHLDLIRVIKASPNPRLHGLIIGSGPDDAALREAIGSDPRIHITGFVNQRAMPVHYLAGDIGFIPSSRDPHPLVATEMAMCGIPLVVSDKTGVWGPHDVVRDGRNGFVYSCGDVSAAALRIAQLASDLALRRRMGAEGRRLAEGQAATVSAGVVERAVVDDHWDDLIGE